MALSNMLERPTPTVCSACNFLSGDNGYIEPERTPGGASPQRFEPRQVVAAWPEAQAKAHARRFAYPREPVAEGRFHSLPPFCEDFGGGLAHQVGVLKDFGNV